MNPQDLKARLLHINYPCYLVVHGPARDYRTRFRGEHGGAFNSGIVNNADEAFAMIEGTRYDGYYSEMDLIAVSIKNWRTDWEKEELEEKGLPEDTPIVPELVEERI